MKIFEIGTGYTSIPARIGAATEIVVEELTKSMVKKNKDVIIVDIQDKNRGSNELPIKEAYMPQFFSSTDTKLGIVHKLKRVFYSVSLALKLKRILKKEDRCTFHFHNQYNLFFFLKLTPKQLRRKANIIYTVHSYIWFGEWAAIENTIKRKYFQEVYSIKNADQVFVLNEITRNHLIKELGIDHSKIILVPNGVNTEVYKPLDENENNAKKAVLGITGKTVFFQAGSVCERKNQLGSLELLLPLLKSNSDCVFAYAGGIIDPEYNQILADYTAKNKLNDQVIYLGELAPGEELNKYYSLSSAYMFSSKSEAFSLVILEALSAGVPVIMNANIKLEIPGKNNNGILKYQDEKDFSTLVEEEILNKENHALHSENGRRLIEKQYSWDAVAEQYLEKIS
ncbi:glycosyltransferase family 4 protein [Mangrovibacterium diazotrophicum]|uniref:Glycosyltransferase involved in cell wall biosynthesis n=1 Tax=Mangrovibacterium diazotrophicum TaxID=1261403 RepID=A0A419W940_9BACT|nr:glycosyltransferase family 4 protein [Mangrovibacterium diazotrophicum]RKD91985.1 glycosyltransferase involved in cell wall biosynthesis [Mangrovibacterium diazotrophicum]